MKRCSDFNKERNMTTTFGSYLAGCPYDEELAGPNGMHFHVWVPEGTTTADLLGIQQQIQSDRDMVSMTYDFLDEGEVIEAKDTKPAMIEALRQAIARKSLVVLKWKDKQTLTVDLFSASTLVGVYDALNDSNQMKIDGMIEKGPAGAVRAIDIAFKALKKRKNSSN